MWGGTRNVTIGNRIVMNRSMCGSGFQVSLPSEYAVVSPCLRAAYPCAYSCATIENSNTGATRMNCSKDLSNFGFVHFSEDRFALEVSTSSRCVLRELDLRPFRSEISLVRHSVFGDQFCQISLQQKRTCGNRAPRPSAIARRNPHCVQLSSAP